jgi:hypothetical protein
MDSAPGLSYVFRIGASKSEIQIVRYATCSA